MFLTNPEYARSKHLPTINRIGSQPSKVEGIAALTLTAIGVVFGDIGTSPLYALKACFDPKNGIALNHDSVFGVVSMIFWAFILVVSLKYISFVMRANNEGEGGILALMALTMSKAKYGTRPAQLLILVGVFGACLFYGDAVITPAISVLSALEGLQVISSNLNAFILPLTIAILIGLFLLEKKGTAIVGSLFGPIMIIWFSVIGLMGLMQILNFPHILLALNPVYAINFITQDATIAFTVAGSIFLVLTGAEALYADMGHFGIKPIQLTWFALVMPCLLLNYFGQGALLISAPESIANPFYKMVPQFLYFPLVILSTIATVIASQACISGAYSMTRQAILLGFLPRMRIVFTSDKEMGQIYIPFINWLLCSIVVLVVLAFQKSEYLASAYGVAVSTTMLMTTLLTAVVMRVIWKWNLLLVVCTISALLLVDIGFFVSNLSKVSQGGWLPLLIGGISFLLMITWHQGRELIRLKTNNEGVEVSLFIQSVFNRKPPLKRVKGTAIFLNAQIDLVPNALVQNLLHNKVFHERIVFLKISSWSSPRIDDQDRITLKELRENIFLVRALYGFKETPKINHILELLNSIYGINCNQEDSAFFLSRDSLIENEVSKMSWGREKIFLTMAKHASKAEDFYNFDPRRVIKLGALVDL